MNRRGLVEILNCIRQKRADVQLVLFVVGPLLDQTNRQVAEYGLEEVVLFAGLRPDVPLMPAVREGLPLTMLKVYAADLPTVISDMPGMREANEVRCRGKLLPVGTPAQRWAEETLAALEVPKPDAARSLARFRQSPFDSNRAARITEQTYREATEQAVESS
jgi:glycosyltransferase involved in cell wall biosynthesis